MPIPVRNWVLFLAWSVSLYLGFEVSVEREYLFVFWLPIPSVLILTFLFFKEKKWFFVSASALLGVVFYKALMQGMWVSVTLYMGALGVMAYLIERIQVRIASENKMSETILEKSEKSLGLMKSRFDQEEEKIRAFQNKVDSLTRLFEVAKDFNVCLTFDSLLETIQKSVLGFLQGARLRLLVLPSGISDELKSFELREGLSEIWKVEKPSGDFLQAVRSLKEPQVIRAEGENVFIRFLEKSGAVQYPLWIFPLQSEKETIALLFFEGAVEDEFYQFQIIAGQLALQIQKTLLYEKVHSLSIYDGLTQVYTRRHFDERFEEEFKRAFSQNLSLSILMLDLDHFKLINDRFGHLVGDRILKEIAEVIRGQIRTVDLVGRYGGEEFILVLPGTDKKGSFEAAERIRSAVAKKKFKVYDEEIRVTASIGIASFPEDFVKKESEPYRPEWKRELVSLSDSALYLAKEDGRNQVKVLKNQRKG